MSKDTLGGCVFLNLDFKPFFFDLGFVKLRARQWRLCDFTGITFKYPYHVFFFWFTKIFFFHGLWWLQRTHDSYYNRKVVTYDLLFLVYRLTFLLFFVCSLLMRGHDMSRRAAHRTWNGLTGASAKLESSDIERSTIQSYTNFGLKAKAI